MFGNMIDNYMEPVEKARIEFEEAKFFYTRDRYLNLTNTNSLFGLFSNAHRMGYCDNRSNHASKLDNGSITDVLRWECVIENSRELKYVQMYYEVPRKQLINAIRKLRKILLQASKSRTTSFDAMKLPTGLTEQQKDIIIGLASQLKYTIYHQDHTLIHPMTFFEKVCSFFNAHLHKFCSLDSTILQAAIVHPKGELWGYYQDDEHDGYLEPEECSALAAAYINDGNQLFLKGSNWKIEKTDAGIRGTANELAIYTCQAKNLILMCISRDTEEKQQLLNLAKALNDLNID